MHVLPSSPIRALVAALSFSVPAAAQAAFFAAPCPTVYQSNQGLVMSVPAPPVAGSSLTFDGNFWITSQQATFPSVALAVMVMGLTTPSIVFPGCVIPAYPSGTVTCGVHPSPDVVMTQLVPVVVTPDPNSPSVFHLDASHSFSVPLPAGATGLVFYGQSFVLLPPASSQVQTPQLTPCPVLGSDVWTSNTYRITVQ